MGVIYVTGAPRTGKTTFATQLAQATGARLIRTDDFLGLEKEARCSAISTLIDDTRSKGQSVLVEGCEGDRLLAAGIDPDLLIWLGSETIGPEMAGLASRSKKAFLAFQGPKYRLRWRG